MSIESKYHYDDLSDTLTIERTEDVSPIITQVAQERQQFDGYKSETFNKVGTIPMIIIEQYLKEFGVSYHEFLNNAVHIKRIMNDPNYSKFKIITGKI